MASVLGGAKGNWILAGLLAAALVWAYWAAHPAKNQPSGADEPFTLWEVAPKNITRISVHTAKRRVFLQPEAAAEGAAERAAPYIWVSSENLPPAGQPQPEEPAEDLGQPDQEKPLGPQFKGNRSAVEAFSSLASLLVQRRVGKLDELENTLQYGLPSELEYVELERASGDPLRLYLGGSTYGDSYRYVHFAQDGAVYLLKSSTVQGLTRSPIRLMDRDLFPFPTASAVQLDLRMGSSTVSFFRLTSSAADSPDWGLSPDAEAGEAAVQAWIAELAKLKAQNFAGHEPAADGEPALEVTLTAEGQAPATLKLLEQQDERNWLAASTHTRYPVRLNGRVAGSLLDNAKPLFDLK